MSGGGGVVWPGPGLLWVYWVGSAFLWLGLSWVVAWRWRLPQKPGPAVVLGLAVGVRVGYAVLMPPTLSDDIWRYLWDGRTLSAGMNPYAEAPAEALARLRAEGVGSGEGADEGGGSAEDRERWQLLTRINHPELVTIYQPTSQWFFAGVVTSHDWVTGWGRKAASGGLARGLVEADGVGDAESEVERDGGGEGKEAEALARWFRLALVLVDVPIILLLMRQLRELGRSVWWSVLYAWSPLAITEVAWSGHQDGVGILFLMGALMLGQRAGRGRGAWWCGGGAGVLLALSAGVKPIVLPLALPMAWKLWCDAGPGRRRWALGRIGVSAAACVAALALLYLPFMWMEGGLSGMWETGRRFVSAWRFNGSVHRVLEAAAGGWAEPEVAKGFADAGCGLLLAGVLGWASVGHRVPWRAAVTYLFAGVCLSSTAHPWYLLWALALLPVAWSAGPTVVAWAVWVASLTLGWSYAAYLRLAEGSGYTVGVAGGWAIWLPIGVALVYGVARVVGRRPGQRRG